MLLTRRLTALAVGLAAFGAAAGSAGATTTATNCKPTTTQAFAAYGDAGSYFRVAGGNFEGGAPGWLLAGGAKLVAGNNTAGGDSSKETTSLSLPTASSATSPAVCVTAAAPSLRFYVRNTGAATARLGVTVNFTGLDGRPATLVVAKLGGTGTWQPTPVVFYYVNLLALVSPDGTTDVSFRFAPLDSTGQWLVDDVYVDPFKRK